MKLTIQTLHFKESDNLYNYIFDKVEKLSRYATNILTTDVCLKKNKAENGKSYLCEIKLTLPGYDLFVKRNEGSYEKAVINATEAMQKQLRKKNQDK